MSIRTKIQIISTEFQEKVLLVLSGRGRGREVVAAISVTMVRNGWSVDDCGYQRTWPKKWAAMRDATQRAENALFQHDGAEMRPVEAVDGYR